MVSTEIEKLENTAHRIDAINNELITEKFISPLRELEDRIFNHKWKLEDKLAARSVHWRRKENDKNHNSHLRRRIDYLCKVFRVEEN
jgi:hypothetical protein